MANWAAAELIEAAARSGMRDKAIETTGWIAEMTAASGTGWALGVEARAQALLAEGEAAQRAHSLPEVAAVWEPMGACCTEMEFPEVEQIA